MPRFRRPRRRRGRRYGRRKSRFSRRVMRAEVRNADTKKVSIIATANMSVAQGDGVSRVVYIWSPLTEITQGTGVGNFLGRSIYPTGIQIRGNATVPAASNFENHFLRFTLFWSRTQARYQPSPQVTFGNTTTAAANPTQLPPFANPRIFDDLSAQYVSNGFVSQFDTTNIKVASIKTVPVNMMGTSNGTKIFKIFLRFPRRKLVWNDPAEGALNVAPNFPLVGNYYLIMQLFGPSGTAGVANTVLVTLDMQAHLYWKDPSG